MKLSRNTHSLLESFFRVHFDDPALKLPDFQLYVKGGSKFVSKWLSIQGITIGNHMFIKPALITRKTSRELKIPTELLAHEATHVLQYQKLGFLKFFYTYLKGYWGALQQKEKWDFDSRLEAYREIPHEVEARACAAEFLKWLEKTKVNPENEK